MKYRVYLAAAMVAVTAFGLEAHAALATGNIAVYRDASLLGYLSKNYDGQRSYTYSANAANAANALTVQFDTSTTVFDITAVNGPSPAFPFVGAVGGSAGYNFAPGQVGYAYLSGTGHTDAGATPSFSAGHAIQSLGYNAPAESMIWSLIGDVLSAQWINTDGSAHPTSTFYDPAVDFLGLVGDFSRFVSTFPNEGAYLVTLRFVGDFADPTDVPEPSSILLLGLGLAGLAAVRRSKHG